MSKKTIYLAGTMTGNTVGYCRAWREYATTILENNGFSVLNPLRGLELEDSTVITTEIEAAQSRNLFARDLSDVDNADIVLAVFSGASTGTGFELGYAFAYEDQWLGNKTLIVVSSTKYPFLIGCADYFTDNLDSAIEYILQNK